MNRWFNRMFTVLLLSLLISANGLCMDKDHFDLSTDLRQYYQTILTLDWQKADSISAAIKNQDPENALVILFDNYSLVTRLIIQDKRAGFYEFKHRKDEYLKRLKKADKSSPYYRYVRAEVLLQWSILNYKYDNKLAAFKDVWTAFRLLEENLELHPEFILSYRSLGLLHAFMGTMPISESMKWLLERMSGMSGSIQEGMGEIKRVIDYGNSHPGYLFHEECKALYAYLLLHLENKPEAAWSTIQSVSIPAEESPMVAFAFTNLALKTGRLEECIEYSNRIPMQWRNRLPFNYFVKGKAELFLGLTSCRESFVSFLKNHDGESYRYAAYQKIAWSYLIENDERSYRWHMDQCLPERKVIVGEDKDAYQEARKTNLPNRYLLRARLLYDGQQFSKALDVLQKNRQLANYPASALEYYYRLLGRVFQGLNRKEDAVSALTRTYEIGLEHQAYYACNAALQLGLIGEADDNVELANKWFHRCLDMKPEAYRKSLHHKAKAGLKRLNRLN